MMSTPTSINRLWPRSALLYFTNVIISMLTFLNVFVVHPFNTISFDFLALVEILILIMPQVLEYSFRYLVRELDKNPIKISKGKLEDECSAKKGV